MDIKRLRARPVDCHPVYGAAMEDAAVEIERLRHVLARAAPLVALLSVRQVIEAGDVAIDAAGLNPWCMNEGLAEGHERINCGWLQP